MRLIIDDDIGIPHSERVNSIGEVGAITGGILRHFLVLDWAHCGRGGVIEYSGLAVSPEAEESGSC